jgi:hypothetical protein
MIDNKKFSWFQYLGHFAQIIVYLATFAYFVGNHAKTLEVHTKEIEAITQEIKDIRKDLNSFSNSGGAFSRGLEDAVKAHEARIQKTEQALGKIDVIQNDLDWFKKYLTEEKKQK